MSTHKTSRRGAPRAHSRSAKGLALSVSTAAMLTGGGLFLTSSFAQAQGAPNGSEGRRGHDGVLWLNEQSVDVTNEGWAHADSGSNEAVGNASVSDAMVRQYDWDGDGTLDATVSNTSGGTAGITSGAAAAAGNGSQTSVSQTHTPPTPETDRDRIISHQSVSVSNYGNAEANSGGNQAVGNASSSVATTVQSTASGSTMTASASNVSSGTATVSTGAASASGNVSSTSVSQG
jgi:hypothetical protein